MRLRVWIPIALFACGLALIAWSTAAGEAEVSLFLIFPVFSGSSGLFLMGTIMIILSFITGFVMLAMGQLEAQVPVEWSQAGRGQSVRQPAVQKEYGGVVLIGPIPIAFGSNRTVALFMLVLGIVLAIILLGILAAVS